MHARRRLALLDQFFFTRQPQCQLVGQQGDQKKSGAAQAGLQPACIEITRALH